MAQETRLQKVVNQMIITRADGLMLGDIQHNNTITETFSDVKSNNFNIDIANFVLNNLFTNNHRWYWYSFTKTQLRKINSIMKSKSKATLQKRVYSFSDLITKGYYTSLFNKKIIKEWIEFCNQHKLDSGLVKVNKVDRIMAQVEKVLG